ncbi:MAG: PTPA-CTERM sorting domain-containing protein, partial [Cyanobacteria bacterium J06554_6]
KSRLTKALIHLSLKLHPWSKTYDCPAQVIFRINSDSKFTINNSSIFVHDDMSLNSVLFYAYGGQTQNDNTIDFSNAIVNGAAFWNLADIDVSDPIGNNPLDGGVIKASDAQMCTQFVGGTIDVSNGRMSRCEPSEIPTPALLPGLLGLGAAVLRKRSGAADVE